jgi:hypothetical protein
MVNAQDVLDRLLDIFQKLIERMTRRRESLQQRHASGEMVERRTRHGSALLQRLKRGELTLDAFLKTKVERALAPLRGLLDADDVAFLRALALDRFETDPILGGLVDRIAEKRG